MSEDTKALTFTNPRRIAEFKDWPSGRHRVRCRFEVENKVIKGWEMERVARRTTRPIRTHGVDCVGECVCSQSWSKPKRTTYYNRCVVVDGSDGKTYVLAYSQPNAVVIIESNLQYTTYIHEDPKTEDMDGDSRFSTLRTLIRSVLREVPDGA